MSTSLLRLFSRAHYWVNKYILNNACELQRVVLYFKELLFLLLCSTQPNSQMASTKGEEGGGGGGEVG